MYIFLLQNSNIQNSLHKPSIRTFFTNPHLSISRRFHFSQTAIILRRISIQFSLQRIPFNNNFSKSLIPSLKSLIDSGISIVIAPQTISGRLDMSIYTAGRLLNEIGVIGNGCDWLPETALVKLMWVLGHTKDPKKVKEMMLTNVAGEIGQRTVV